MKKNFLVLGLILIIASCAGIYVYFHYASSEPNPCVAYLKFKAEAQGMSDTQLSGALDQSVKLADTSQDNWAHFSALQLEYQRRNDMHDQTEWDSCE